MILLFVMGLGLVVASLVLAAFAVGSGQPVGGVTRSLAVLDAMTSAPSEITAELDPPFGERVLRPLQARALTVGRRLSGADSADRIRRKLDLAGNPRDWSVDRVVSGKVIGAVALALVGPRRRHRDSAPPSRCESWRCSPARRWASSCPTWYLYQRAYDRSQRIQRDLADAIDLMTISVESGLGFDAAVQQVARNTEGPLAEEFSRMLREMQIGQGRSDALRALGERTDVADLKSFVGAMVQADVLRHPDRQRAAGAVQGDAGQAPPARRDEGAAGAGEDHHPADLLHPALPVHRGAWDRR